MIKTLSVALLVVGCQAPIPSTVSALTDAPASERITTENRRDPGHMFGGWGEGLRSVMRAPDGRLWFAADTGSDVNRDPAVAYYVLDGGVWSRAGQVDLPAVVQQNVASVLVTDADGTWIRSYGVDVQTNQLIECSFDVAAASGGCSPVVAVAPSSNYVGAAVGPGHTTMVWWTTVGPDGGAGQWSYLFSHGHGWQGPVTMTLPGFTDFSYVYASFRDAGDVMLAGQLVAGAAPNWTYRAGITELTLGQVPVLATPFDASWAAADDVWIDPASTDVHVLVRSLAGQVGHFVNGQSTFVTPGYRARFLADGSMVFGTPLAIRTATNPDEAIPFSIPGSGITSASAIYVETQGLDFAVCGQAWDRDTDIWHVHPTP